MGLVSPLDALLKIPSGSRVFIAPACGEPTALTEALGAHWPELPPLHLLFGLHPRPYPFVKGLGQKLDATTWNIVPSSQTYVAVGAVECLPARYSQLPRLLRPDGALGAGVALLQVSPPDRDGYCSLGAAVSLTRDLVDRVPMIIAEINPNAPRTLGDTLIPVDKFDLLVEGHAPPVPWPSAPVSEAEEAIGRYVAGIVPDGATIEFGLGAIPDAVAWALQDKNDLGIQSGLIGDSVKALIERGVVNNSRKPFDQGLSVVGELMGSRALLEWAHGNHSLCMRSANYTHNPAIISQIPSMVAINSALQVDLAGQVNAESLGERQISTVGGLYDFVEGALASLNGKSIVALQSTAGGDKFSRIVRHLPSGSTVTVPRYLADCVVTEYGVAELRGRTLSERREALIRIAHPAFRDGLANENGLSELG